jgi:small multidrug resistance pump
MGALLLTMAVIFNSIANGFFKHASSIQELSTTKIFFLLLGLFLGLVNTICYIKALEKIDLGIAFPLFSAASIVLIAVISFFVFKEGLSFKQLAGLVTICAGMVLLLKTS